MNLSRFFVVIFLGVLSLISFGEADHIGFPSYNRPGAVSGGGGSLGFNPCSLGRPPYLPAVPQVNSPPALPVAVVNKPTPSPVPFPQPSEKPTATPEVLGNLKLEASAELELLKNNYDPSLNCIRLVKRAESIAVEVSNKSCGTKADPVLTIPTEGNNLIYQGKTIGTWDKVGGTFRLIEFCSGRFGLSCRPLFNGPLLKSLAPAIP